VRHDLSVLVKVVHVIQVFNYCQFVVNASCINVFDWFLQFIGEINTSSTNRETEVHQQSKTRRVPTKQNHLASSSEG
jgi:hypothetical protein